MSKRKNADEPNNNPGQPQTEFPPQEALAEGEISNEPSPKKSQWQARFGIFGDYQAGVRLIEDRQNRRMTIQFDGKPSDPVRAVMKGEGYRFDPSDQLWYKFIDQAKPRQSRQEAGDLVLKVANLIRAEKGLEQRESNSVGV